MILISHRLALCLFIGSFHPALGILALLAYLVVGVVIPFLALRAGGESGMEFHDSIRNNLRIAKPDASDAEIEAACKKASVHEFIISYL